MMAANRRGLSRALFALVPLLLNAAPAFAQGGWSPEEKSAVLAYWQDRATHVAEPVGEAGAEWVVRATPAGSVWIREVYKLFQTAKVVPTQDPLGNTPEQREWTAWIDRQVARDWADAELRARELNRGMVSEPPGKPERTALPVTKLDRKPGTDKVGRLQPLPVPPIDDPCPATLVALLGAPPRFSAPVRPLRHTVTFDDGTVLTYVDNVKVRAKYAYYRFAPGVASGGRKVSTLPPSELDKVFRKAGITGKEQKVMKAVSLLEGGFDSVNTYDTGYVSVGFIQFACLSEGTGSLGGMMAHYKASNPIAFDRDFRRYGIDVDGNRLVAMDLESGEIRVGAPAALEIIKDKRLTAVFQRAGLKSVDFCVAQLQAAKKQFYPGDEVVVVNLGGVDHNIRLTDVFRTEAGLATLMDRKVNTGKLGGIKECIENCAAQYGITTPTGLRELEYVLIQAMTYRVDYTTTALAKPRDNTAELSRRGSRLGRSGGGR